MDNNRVGAGNLKIHLPDRLSRSLDPLGRAMFHIKDFKIGVVARLVDATDDRALGEDLLLDRDRVQESIDHGLHSARCR